MNEAWTSILRDFVDAAFQYGPFFFSIWFLYAFARWSYRNYAEISAKSAASPEIERKHWLYFVSSTIFGCGLVVVCTVWWLGYRPQVYVFTGEIGGFDIADVVTSSEVYLKEWSNQNTSEKEISFVVVSSEPFRRGQSFRMHLKQSSEELRKTKSKPLQLKYDGQHRRKFLIAIDQVIPVEDIDKPHNKQEKD